MKASPTEKGTEKGSEKGSERGTEKRARLAAQRAFFDRIVSELVVAIRGRRSQTMLARRSGLSVQRIAAWERGRRQPNVSDLLRLARAAKLPVDERFAALLPALADVRALHVEPLKRDAGYIQALVQSVLNGLNASAIARDAGIHRVTLASWARGATEPRMAEVLALFGALHYPTASMLSLFVDPSMLPSQREDWRELQATTELFESSPHGFAVLAALDLTASTTVSTILRATGLDRPRALAVLAELEQRGCARREGKGWVRGRDVWLVRPPHVQRYYGFLAAEQIGHDPRARRGLHVGALDDAGHAALLALSARFMRDVQLVYAAALERPSGPLDRVVAVSAQWFDLAHVAPTTHARALMRARTFKTR